MNIIIRIPTPTMYSYVEVHGTPEEVESMTKKQLNKILEKAHAGCLMGKLVGATPEQKFEAELEQDMKENV